MKKWMGWISLLWVFGLYSQSPRPVRDNVGFCWDRVQMARLIAYLEKNETGQYSGRDLVAGISPHDDYLYAGRIYFPLFKNIRAREVVIFGVTHAAVRQEIGDPQGCLIMEDYPAWSGLGRPVAISGLRDFIKANLDKECLRVSNRAHELEHSIEALIPFLQYTNPDVHITPIMVSPMPWEKMAEISDQLAMMIGRYMQERGWVMGKDIFFLISADANHYGRDFNNIPFGEDEAAHGSGIDQDLRWVRQYLCGPVQESKIEGLTKELWGVTYRDYRRSYWCGKYDIPFGLMTIDKIVRRVLGRNIQGKLFRYSDTYSEGVIPLKMPGFGITAPFSLKHWVGFFSVGYYL